jgi:hypothetical protein
MKNKKEWTPMDIAISAEQSNIITDGIQPSTGIDDEAHKHMLKPWNYYAHHLIFRRRVNLILYQL